MVSMQDSGMVDLVQQELTEGPYQCPQKTPPRRSVEVCHFAQVGGRLVQQDSKRIDVVLHSFCLGNYFFFSCLINEKYSFNEPLMPFLEVKLQFCDTTFLNIYKQKNQPPSPPTLGPLLQPNFRLALFRNWTFAEEGIQLYKLG